MVITTHEDFPRYICQPRREPADGAARSNWPCEAEGLLVKWGGTIRRRSERKSGAGKLSADRHIAGNSAAWITLIQKLHSLPEYVSGFQVKRLG